ncbi:cytochrome C [Opitutaceae bacterium EW11]|nr:cytochrome C [Opitutaceae bacterium EW11]
MKTPDPREHNTRIEQAGASDESIQDVHAILAREKPEPHEGYSPMPLFVLGFVSAIIFIGAIYIVRHRAGFDPLAYDERYDPSMAATNAAPVKVDPIAEGKKLFMTCAACHQPTGQGVPGVFPPLVKSEWVNGSEDRVIRILLNGLSGPVKVEGNTYNNAMPAFGPGGYGWSDEKISYILTYVRQEWGNTGAPITPEKVAEIRKAVGQRKPWAAEELEAIK